MKMKAEVSVLFTDKRPTDRPTDRLTEQLSVCRFLSKGALVISSVFPFHFFYQHILHNGVVCYQWADPTSVTRLGDLLHFGQLFKVCGKNYFAHIVKQYL